jgi:hypothetical protein
MKRDVIVDEIQNHNDEIGWRFQDAIEKYPDQYKQGVIHHVEYIRQVSLCCEQAEGKLLPLPEKLEI